MMTNTPSGFRDLLPQEARQKEDMIQKIISVYRRYGFVPLETPNVEFTSTLVGDVTDFNLFMVQSSKERKKGNARETALRFDLTVPLARTIAQYPEISKPFKRYQLGEVFRGERPQKGRYRQFTQLDADIVGSKSIYADIEILLMMHAVMEALSVGKFTIKVNTRKILNLLPDYIGFPGERLREVLIVLDKRDKISQEELKSLLLEKNLNEAQAEKLIRFGNLSGAREKVLKQLEKDFSSLSGAEEALDDLRKIHETLSLSGNKTNIIFDMSIIRGLAYYTGTVFETSLDDYPQYGSIYSGGRYDHLIEKLGGSDIPAVGASVGVDRLLAVLQEINQDKVKQREGYVILLHSKEVLPYATEVAEKLRSLGVTADVYLGSGKLGKQFAYGEAKAYAKALLLGEDEMQARSITLRDLETREQEVFAFGELGERLKY